MHTNVIAKYLIGFRGFLFFFLFFFQIDSLNFSMVSTELCYSLVKLKPIRAEVLT